MDNPTILQKVYRVALVALMVIVSVFILFGIFRVLPIIWSSVSSSSKSLSSSLFAPKESITVNISNNAVASGEETQVSFTHTNKKSNGTYQLRFDCKGEDMSLVVIDGADRKTATCGSKTALSNTTFGLIPIFKKANAYVDSNIFVDFIKDGDKVAYVTGTNILTVKNGTLSGATLSQVSQNNTATTTKTVQTVATSSAQKNATSSPAKQTTKQTQNNTYKTNVPKVRDIYIVKKDTGVIVNGIFVPKQTFANDERVSVRFDVGNQGNVPSPAWVFTATGIGQPYTSPVQPSLNPRDVIEYTLTLDPTLSYSGNTLTIVADPANVTGDSVRTNNTLVQNISVY